VPARLIRSMHNAHQLHKAGNVVCGTIITPNDWLNVCKLANTRKQMTTESGTSDESSNKHKQSMQSQSKLKVTGNLSHLLYWLLVFWC